MLMRIEPILKMLLGIIIISFFIVISNEFKTNNFWIDVCLNIPQWLAIFTFFKWRDWVGYEN